MAQLGEFTPKKRIKMKQLLIFLTAYLIASLQLDAQSCIDTVHVKGYYIIMKNANEIGPKITRKKNKTIIERRIDSHYDPSFIPSDSISKKHPLSYWLNHFFGETSQVFISCEKFTIKDFVEKKCSEKLKSNNYPCLFPSLKSNVLYKSTNLNTGDVFEIYYLDACWAKVKIKKESVESSIIPSRIAQRCISPNVTEFDLYCFIRSNEVQMNPQIQDPYITIWRK